MGLTFDCPPQVWPHSCCAVPVPNARPARLARFRRRWPTSKGPSPKSGLAWSRHMLDNIQGLEESKLFGFIAFENDIGGQLSQED